MKTWAIIVIVLAVVVVAIVSISVFGYALLTGLLSPTNQTSTQTWSQYGMSIQYPSGLQAQYKGVFEQQPTSNSGTVYWVWNQARTQLALSWINTSFFDYSAGFDAIYNALLSVATNVTMTGQGNVTMAGSTWQYQTYQFYQMSRMNYETCALYFDPASSRVFEIDYIDTNPTTLSSLMVYGNTFTR